MDSLIQDCIDYLKEVAKTTPSVLATRDEVAYFRPLPPKKKEPAPKPLPPPPTPKIIQPQEKEEIYTPPPPPLPKPITPQAKKSWNDMRQSVEKMFPDMKLRDGALDDTHAKKMSNLYKETYLDASVVVIAFGEVGAGLEFLKNVTHAIDKLIAPAQLVMGSTLEKEKEWDLLLNSPALKAVLCSPWNSWQTTSLATHFRQNGATGEQFLGKQKLLLLEPSTTYLKTPERKRKLWQLITTQLLS